jgi:poly(3-hydroxybutyrate) depolymerase
MGPGRRPGDPTPTLPTSLTIAAFVAVAGSSAEHRATVETDADPADGTRLRTERWTDDDGTVAVLRTIVEGGHTWPSSRGQFSGGGFGATSREIDASAEAIAFLIDPDDGGRRLRQ